MENKIEDKRKQENGENSRGENSEYTNTSKSGDLLVIYNGKLFEKYVAFFIAKELGEPYFRQGVDYCFSSEVERLFKYVKEKKITEKLETTIQKYKEEFTKENKSSSSQNEGAPKNTKEKKEYCKGDFDIIIPNVKKNMFENMLLNSFQKNGNHKFIFGTKKDLPDTFNLNIQKKKADQNI